MTVATPAAAAANGLVKGVSAALPGATSVIMRAPSVVTVSNSTQMAPSSIQKSAATPMSFGKPVPVVATKSPAPPGVIANNDFPIFIKNYSTMGYPVNSVS